MDVVLLDHQQPARAHRRGQAAEDLVALGEVQQDEARVDEAAPG